MQITQTFNGKLSMRPKLQSRQTLIIDAPLDKVWDFSQDLSKIADYHPRVYKVELISGERFRGEGVSYQCHLKDGKNTCIEKDIEIIPKEKIVTIFTADSMGLTKLLPDYVVETTFKKINDFRTQVDIAHHYSSSNWKVRLLNLIIKRKVARETMDTLVASKKIIENRS
jgi:hypothetical protein